MKDFIFNLQRFADSSIPTQIVQESLNTTQSPGLSAEMKEYYAGLITDYAKPNLIHGQFAQKKSVPKNGGKEAEFRRYKPYGVAGKLTEGVTPMGNKLEVDTVSVKLYQYGDYTAVTDEVQLTAIDNQLLECARLHGDQAALTSDSITREALVGGTKVLHAGGANGRASLNSALTAMDIKKAVRMLKNANTRTINGDYICIVHPDVEFDLSNDEAFIEAHKYANPENLYNGEIGKLYGARVIVSTNAKVFEDANELNMPAAKAGFMTSQGDESKAAVYATLVLGADAYGEIELTGGNLKHIFKNFGSGGVSDPLEQRATSGIKFWQAAVILNDDYLVRIESLATA